MISVRRLLITFAVLVPPLALAAPDAVAARRHVRHAAAHHTHRTTQVMTAVYQVAARPHGFRRLHTARASGGHFAQGFDRSLMVGS